MAHKLSIIAMVIILISGTIYYFYINTNTTPSAVTKNLESSVQQMNDNKENNIPKDPPKIEQTIMVDLKGEVKHPGVYPLKEGDRVMDVIKLAGGLTDKADDSQVNFAEHVKDEMIIFVPTKGVSINNQQNVSLGEKNNLTKSDKINLNQADESQLENLPGIGPSKAEAIITYRNEKGAFQSVEDLKKITGIGDKTFEKLKESITVK